MHITINDTLAKELEKRIQDSQEFDSVEAYVNYVLEEVIKQTTTENSAFNSEEEKEVKDRLHDLGYLD